MPDAGCIEMVDSHIGMSGYWLLVTGHWLLGGWAARI